MFSGNQEVNTFTGNQLSLNLEHLLTDREETGENYDVSEHWEGFSI